MADREQNEFNMAVSYLNRLDTLWYASDYSSKLKDADDWYNTLFILFRELSTEMKDEEINELQKSLIKIGNQVRLNTRRNEMTGQVGMNTSLYIDLNDIEIKLRKVMKEAGLQSKMKQDSRLME